MCSFCVWAMNYLTDIHYYYWYILYIEYLLLIYTTYWIPWRSSRITWNIMTGWFSSGGVFVREGLCPGGFLSRWFLSGWFLSGFFFVCIPQIIARECLILKFWEVFLRGSNPKPHLVGTEPLHIECMARCNDIMLILNCFSHFVGHTLSIRVWVRFCFQRFF